MMSSDSGNSTTYAPVTEESKVPYDENEHNHFEEEDSPQEIYISTTAGGDGLEFDKRLGNIFEEIEAIKQGVQVKA
jgi:hypothetical protein